VVNKFVDSVYGKGCCVALNCYRS